MLAMGAAACSGSSGDDSTSSGHQGLKITVHLQTAAHVAGLRTQIHGQTLITEVLGL